MFSLVVAGESIFIPAFHPGRYFKTSLLAALDINVEQLGLVQQYYGWAAMACYVFGGPIADRFSARKLLAGSLLLTGVGSLYMASFPSLVGLKVLFSLWGMSSVLLFWSALIRATREWGGEASQGRAFGLLDGGRGAIAWLIAQASVFIFAGLYDPSAPDAAEQEAAAVETILWLYAGCCAFAAVCIWLFLPRDTPRDSQNNAVESGNALQDIFTLLRMPAIWLHATVIIAAYAAFKSFDFYGIYTEDALGFSTERSAETITNLSFLRIIATIAAGWLADRWLGASGALAAGFAILGLCFFGFYYLPPGSQNQLPIIANMAVSCSLFFAARGVYFALLEEASIPRSLSGSACGVVSFIGYTPEIFMPVLGGSLIQAGRDAGDPIAGYQTLWLCLVGFMVVGFAASLGLRGLSAVAKKVEKAG